MRVRLPKSNAAATVSDSVSDETLTCLDEMMVTARKMFDNSGNDHHMVEVNQPQAKPCADKNCHHSRRQHLHKTKHGKGVNFHYAACRVEGCKCPNYYSVGDSL